MAFPELNIKTVNIIKSMNGNSRGFGYVQLESVVRIAVLVLRSFVLCYLTSFM